jgi:hypothetical protein
MDLCFEFPDEKGRLNMKNAIVAAVIAALVASGSTLAASQAINGRHIARHSIPANRLTPSAHKSLRGQRGARGAQGPVGHTGASGSSGPRGLTTAVSPSLIDTEQAEADLDTSPQTLTAYCPGGDVAIGGGYNLTQGTGDVVQSGAYNLNGVSGWVVEVVDGAGYGGAPSLTVNVSCEPVQDTSS